jgi:hypothetical protein
LKMPPARWAMRTSTCVYGRVKLYLQRNKSVFRRSLTSYLVKSSGSTNERLRNRPVQYPARTRDHRRGRPALFLPNAKAAERFFDFFTSNIAAGKPVARIARMPAGSPSGASAEE